MSLLIAFFLDIPAINMFMTSGVSVLSGEEDGGVMTMLYLICVVGIFIVGFFTKSRKKHVSNSMIMILVYVVILYLVTTMLGYKPLTILPFVGVFTISAFLIPSVAVADTRLLLKGIMLFSIPALSKIDLIFYGSVFDTEIISMGLSYAFLLPVLVSIVYLHTYFRQETKMEKVFTLLLFAINMVFAFFIISFGSRGTHWLL